MIGAGLPTGSGRVGAPARGGYRGAAAADQGQTAEDLSPQRRRWRKNRDRGQGAEHYFEVARGHGPDRLPQQRSFLFHL